MLNLDFIQFKPKNTKINICDKEIEAQVYVGKVKRYEGTFSFRYFTGWLLGLKTHFGNGWLEKAVKKGYISLNYYFYSEYEKQIEKLFIDPDAHLGLLGLFLSKLSIKNHATTIRFKNNYLLKYVGLQKRIDRGFWFCENWMGYYINNHNLEKLKNPNKNLLESIQKLPSYKMLITLMVCNYPILLSSIIALILTLYNYKIFNTHKKTCLTNTIIKIIWCLNLIISFGAVGGAIYCFINAYWVGTITNIWIALSITCFISTILLPHIQNAID